MNTRNYRIRTDVTKDQVVRAKLTQDIDFLEILSLKISQEDTYKLHASNYGVVVGRVLANDAFGIPNAKVSVFIPLSDDDKMRSEITSIYPYTDIQTRDSENRRYNLLPDSSNDVCYRVVGTFPNKTLVLDNNTEIEVFEKYWKYTTITNKSGDYMIFGVPTGTQQVHVDVDLSDIGVLSQKPRDFIYKGYNITQFDNASQFKDSTNLDNLSQLLSQNSAVHVYPFFGENDIDEIAITRCDLQVQYKFEPTCVFFGSIVSDNFSNNVGDKCNPSKFCGFNRNLVAGEGTIEMIRKTKDSLVEEFQIQGNRLIDGDGVWCYQIPMNLDYIGTDEFGNIVPTDDPKKGIPTRTSVRFRISMQETMSEGIARHRAKYLVPNNLPLDPNMKSPEINGKDYDSYFEFGSATPDDCFRDLYWNKVYSVKNYIPRIQTNKQASNLKYSAIRTVNDSQGKNPFPFNNARFKLFFSYRLLCIIISIIIFIIGVVNFSLTVFGWMAKFFNKIWIIGNIIAAIFTVVQSSICALIPCVSLRGISETDVNVEYFPMCGSNACMRCQEEPCVKETSIGSIMDVIQQLLAQEYDTVNLDFYNDWINGCLYLPLWFWKKTKKKKFFFGLFTRRAINRFCNCDTRQKHLHVVRGCALEYNQRYELKTKSSEEKAHDKSAWIKPNRGIVKEFENDKGLHIYYYVPGAPTSLDYKNEAEYASEYVVMYSTDIILLGSLNECDLDNLPRPFINLPSTTANIPFISTLKTEVEGEDSSEEGTSKRKGTVEVTGMDWLGNVTDGLLMDLTCTNIYTRPKSCINLYRMSELGISLDAYYDDVTPVGKNIIYSNNRVADGLITRYEIIDNETRAMFASLNHNGLKYKTLNKNTGYDTYKLEYCYPVDFDGHMSNFAYSQTKKMDVVTHDVKDINYVNYRFGTTKDTQSTWHFYNGANNFPVYMNSFYFYFGLNEGNTAIDKFNKMYYAECFKNEVYPFGILVKVNPPKWCVETVDDYGTITIELKGIKLPYSYKLYKNTMEGNPLLEDNNLITNKIEFNKIFRTDESTKVPTSSETTHMVEEGVYYIEVTDASNNTVVKKIYVQAVPMDITIIGNRLGNKYYKGITTKEEMCDEFSGEINLTEIILDNQNVLAVDGDGKLLGSNHVVVDESSIEYITEITSSTTTLELNQGTIKDDDGNPIIVGKGNAIKTFELGEDVETAQILMFDSNETKFCHNSGETILCDSIGVVEVGKENSVNKIILYQSGDLTTSDHQGIVELKDSNRTTISGTSFIDFDNGDNVIFDFGNEKPNVAFYIQKQNVVKGDIIEISGKTTFIVEKIIGSGKTTDDDSDTSSGKTICVYNQSDVRDFSDNNNNPFSPSANTKVCALTNISMKKVNDSGDTYENYTIGSEITLEKEVSYEFNYGNVIALNYDFVDIKTGFNHIQYPHDNMLILFDGIVGLDCSLNNNNENKSIKSFNTLTHCCVENGSSEDSVYDYVTFSNGTPITVHNGDTMNISGGTLGLLMDESIKIKTKNNSMDNTTSEESNGAETETDVNGEGEEVEIVESVGVNQGYIFIGEETINFDTVYYGEGKTRYDNEYQPFSGTSVTLQTSDYLKLIQKSDDFGGFVDIADDEEFFSTVKMSHTYLNFDVIDVNSATDANGITDCNDSDNFKKIVNVNIEFVGGDLFGDEYIPLINNTICDCTSYATCADNINSTDNVLSCLKVWIPGRYNIIVNQYCNGKLNDNKMTTIVNIQNGEPFMAMINSVPVEFLNDEVIKGNMSNWTSLEDINNTFTFNSDEKWKLYKNGKLLDSNLGKWEDLVDVETEELYDEDNNFIGNDLVLDSKVKIITEKLNAVTRLCNGSYIDGYVDKELEISSRGGKLPILYQGVYPYYEDFDGDLNNSEKSRQFASVLHDKEGYVSCPYNLANVVYKNYAEQLSNVPYYTYFDKAKNFGKNKMFSNPNKLGNYFAAFTDDGKGSLRFPENAEPLVITLPKVNQKYNGGTNFMKTYFVDKRLDYEVFAKIVPFGVKAFEQKDAILKSSVHCTIYNGVKLKYDKNYNIVAPLGVDYVSIDEIHEEKKDAWNLETTTIDKIEYVKVDDVYEYKINTNDLTVVNTSGVDTSQFYELTLQHDLIKIDLQAKSLDIDENIGVHVEKRVIDQNTIEYHITNLNLLTMLRMDMVGCTYPNGISIEVADTSGDTQLNDYKFICQTDKAEENTFSIQCGDIFSTYHKNGSLESCAIGQEFDVEYDYYYKEDPRGGGGNHTFSGGKKVKIKFRINNDKLNDTHNSFTYFPYLVNSRDIKNLLEKTTFVDASLYLENLGNSEIDDTPGRLNWKDITGDIKDNYTHNETSQDYLSRTRFDYPVKNKIGRYNNLVTFADKNNKDKVIFDDDSYVQNAVYEKEINFGAKMEYHIVAFRNYLNNSGDNLLKNIIAMYISKPYTISTMYLIYDKGDIKYWYEDDEIDESVNGSNLVEFASHFENGFTGFNCDMKDIIESSDGNGETTGDTSNTVKRMVIEMALHSDTLTNADVASAVLTKNKNGTIIAETSVYQIFSKGQFEDDVDRETSKCGILVKMILDESLGIKNKGDYPNNGLDLFIMDDNQIIYRINLHIDSSGNLVNRG